MHPARARLAFLSAALIAAIAAILTAVAGSGIVSAQAASAAQNRVGAAHPVMILAVGPSTIVFPVQRRGEGCPQARFTADTCFAAEEGSEAVPQLVYRGGSAQPANLTPRPGIDTTGLSTFDNPNAAAPNGGKVQVIDTSQLKLVQAFPDAPLGHVSLAPPDSSEIEAWAATRGTGEISPFTQDIMDAIIDVIRVPKP